MGLRAQPGHARTRRLIPDGENIDDVAAGLPLRLQTYAVTDSARGIDRSELVAVALRLGYTTLGQQVTAGVGVQHGNFRFDYAAGYQAALGMSHSFGLSWQWLRQAQAPATPETE